MGGLGGLTAAPLGENGEANGEADKRRIVSPPEQCCEAAGDRGEAAATVDCIASELGGERHPGLQGVN